MRPKYAQSVDLNQAEIVQALRDIGCDVEIIGRPVDLLVGYRKRNFLIEVKREGRTKRNDQQGQRDWIKAWRGQAMMVTDKEQAIRLVTTAYKD